MAALTGADRYGEHWSRACDGVVLVTQQVSEDSLYHELTARGDGLAVFRIGDAVAPRLISEAIFDGHRLGREIDGPDPARPAPYLREPADIPRRAEREAAMWPARRVAPPCSPWPICP